MGLNVTSRITKIIVKRSMIIYNDHEFIRDNFKWDAMR